MCPSTRRLEVFPQTSLKTRHSPFCRCLPECRVFNDVCGNSSSLRVEGHIASSNTSGWPTDGCTLVCKRRPLMNMHPVVPSFKLGKLVNLFSPEFSLTVGRRNDLMERALVSCN